MLRGALDRGIERAPSSDRAPRRALFRGSHAPSFPGGQSLLLDGSLRGVATGPRLQPNCTSRSPFLFRACLSTHNPDLRTLASFSRFPPDLVRSIQPGVERNDFPCPGHVPDTRKDGPNGPRGSGYDGRSRLRGGCAGPLARPRRHEMRPPACRGRWPRGGGRCARSGRGWWRSPDCSYPAR